MTPNISIYSSPGQYRLFLSESEIKAEKERLARRKVNVSERITDLDAVQYEANNLPGVGAYTASPLE
jgi:hypothetical protein